MSIELTAALNAAADALRATGYTVTLTIKVPKDAKVAAQREDEASFEQAYAAMPKWRSGSSRKAALIQFRARINAGATSAEIVAGTEKYARYCAATGCEIKMAQTFFGPGEHFTADWTPPKGSGKFNFAGADRAGDQVAQAASMAKHKIVISDNDIHF